MNSVKRFAVIVAGLLAALVCEAGDVQGVPPRQLPGETTKGQVLAEMLEQFDSLHRAPEAYEKEHTLEVPLTSDAMRKLEKSSRDCGSCGERQTVVLGPNLAANHPVRFQDVNQKQVPESGRAHDGGVLKKTATGDRVWSQRVVSAGAVALRLHLTDFELPAGATMHIYTLAGEVHGPYTGRGPLDAGEFWSNTVSADEVVIEVRIPAAVQKGELKDAGFTIAEVAHIVSWAGAFASESEKSLASCIRDASCHGPDDFPVFNQVSNAVALIVYPKDGEHSICSGTLINDGMLTPYILTAEHCVNTQSSASGLEAIWRFRTSSCNSGFHAGASRAGFPRSLGSTLLTTRSANDAALLELAQDPPGGSWFLGWTTAEPSSSQSLHRISHPHGAPQAYSQYRVTSQGPQAAVGFSAVDFHTSRMVLGSNMGGSSGSSLVNDDGQIMGQLLGRFCISSCGVRCADCPNVCNRVSSNGTVLWSHADGKFGRFYPYIEEWLEAEPEEIRYSLNISVSPSQGGEVFLSPSPDSNGTYEEGTAVTLTAEAASGYEFHRWDGDAFGTAASITVTMDTDKTIDAWFNEEPDDRWGLTVSITPPGSGSVSLLPDPDANGTFEDGTEVILYAESASGYEFSGWSGATSGSFPMATVTMDGDKAVTAAFNEKPVPIVRQATVNQTVNYGNCWERMGRVRVPGSERMRLLLRNVDIEPGYDFLYIGDIESFDKDPQGFVINVCCGPHETVNGRPTGDVWTEWYDGDTIDLLLDSDVSITGRFTIAQVEYEALDEQSPSLTGALFTGGSGDECETVCFETGGGCGETGLECIEVDTKTVFIFEETKSTAEAELIGLRRRTGIPENAMLPVGKAWKLAPNAAFDEPALIQVPLPPGRTLEDTDILYLHEEEVRWYLGENVVNWMVPGSLVEVTIDGVPHAEFLANHGGTFQVVGKIRMDLVGAGIIDIRMTGSANAWAWLLATLLGFSASLVAARRLRA